MTDYIDLSADYKWDIPGLTKRNIGILSMLLNNLNVPDLLQEFVIAVFVSGDWDGSNEYNEITLQKMSKSLASNLPAQRKLYNRLKQKSPKFFKWQDAKGIIVIDRIILHEHTTHHKTKAKYKFINYEEIKSLFELPLETPHAAIRRGMDEILTRYPTLESQTRRPKRKRPESTAKAAIRSAEETIELTGSIEAANLYLQDAGESGNLTLLITRRDDETKGLIEH